MRTRPHRIAIAIAMIATLLMGGIAQASTTGTDAVIDEATASARCDTSYPDVSGPEPFRIVNGT